MTDKLDTKAIRAKAKMWHLPAGIADDTLALCDALDDLRAEIERLQTIIGNLHAVEEKHRETANAQFHRANRRQVENERLRAELAWYGEQSRLARIIHSEGDSGRHALQADGGHRAGAALAQKGDQP